MYNIYTYICVCVYESGGGRGGAYGVGGEMAMNTRCMLLNPLHSNHSTSPPNISPSQRIVLVTHSNAALNDLFEKILARDVDPRHLLRLGGYIV